MPLIPDRYKTVAGSAVTEFEEKRSKFIGHIKNVSSEEEACEFVRGIKGEYADARHNVYAYIVVDESLHQRFSDDGEPQGTGGMPVLEALKKAELQNVVCVVTRYFGGILLGAPGLTRAYGKSAAMSIDAAGVIERSRLKLFDVTAEYRHVSSFKKVLPESGFEIVSVEFGNNVVFRVGCRPGEESRLEKCLQDITSGAAYIRDAGECFI